MATTERHPLALRIPVDQLAEIDARARSAGLSRTEYMVKCSLGLITRPLDADSRLNEIESRVNRLEKRVDLGGY